MMKKDVHIVFMGTPRFAVASLEILLKNNYTISGVVTTPDKPAGRGQKLRMSDVKEYALHHHLHILQPDNLKNPIFIKELISLHADLFIVVAYRMLPEVVWRIPPLGTVNLHASLLPDYRGAAPINHAIINGETVSGVTTFFIDNTIDTGNIILRKEVPVFPEETAGELHDRLMHTGAEVVLETVKILQQNAVVTFTQETFLQNDKNRKIAPKIFKENCKINWNQDVNIVYNFIRGLSPYPAAFTELNSHEGEKFIIKIFRAEKITNKQIATPGTVIVENNINLYLACTNGWLRITELQLSGKKKLSSADFLNGFSVNNLWTAF
ncbi:MAG: methionyl-tRNA formyltransferase [Lentimicrobiaceae bacterium]|nr:methionyl-tRNA formyltransferase [Lentimicrobiaceae bacterium]